MLFNSIEYIFYFLPISFLIYFALERSGIEVAPKIWLILCSLFFYSWWNPNFLPLLCISILFNYFLGKSLSNELTSTSWRKPIVIFGITFNLALLAYFKYAGFIGENLNLMGANLTVPNIILPLAISFFTFQQIAFLVDSYNNETKEYSFLNYSVFVCFFPQLISGPIVHHKQMMPQFGNQLNQKINLNNVYCGVLIFSIGLFKKVVLADQFAVWANTGYDKSASLDLIDAWITSLSYTFQLYFDFSGYTDMAMGSALLFNIKLPINFNSPYQALSLQDFWRRWHITLSNFLRDYVYVPLGGSKSGFTTTQRNLVVTFFIGGIWHGAAWNYVVWGLLHGLGLATINIWRKFGIKLPAIVSWFITFNFLNFTFVIFRAPNFSVAFDVLKAMTGFGPIKLSHGAYQYLGALPFDNLIFGSLMLIHSRDPFLILWFILGLLIIFQKTNTMALIESFKPKTQTAIYAGAFCSLSVILIKNTSEFLYFNF